MTDPTATALAEEIRAQIADRGWSGRELARRAGVTPSVIGDKLAGKRPFDLAELDAIAGAFGLYGWELLRRAQRDR